ncbi:MAG: DUF1285 domain-containing protein [Pseudomonadota bacterium]
MTQADTLFEQILRLKNSAKYPPVHLWEPEHEGQIDIRIDADGTWFHEGRPFRRQPLVKLFAGIMRREGDAYFLVTPGEKLRITVADVPFIAIDMEVRHRPAGSDLLFTTNVEDYVLVDQDHPVQMRNGRPYLTVRDGLEARLTRSVFYRLVEEGREEQHTLAVYSQGTRFELGATR